MKSIVLKRFEFAWEAHIARGRLVAEGIPAMVLNEHHCSASWTGVYALGLIELRVPESDAATAQSILSRHDAGNYENEMSPRNSGPQKSVCANCASTDREEVRNLWTKNFYAYVMSFAFFGIFWPSKCWIERCRNCRSTVTT